MKEGRKSDQIGRVLQIYSRLAEGYIVKKAEEAERFGVNVRSIARDIDDIRTFLDADSERTGVLNTVIYDRKAGGYRLKTLYQTRLKNSEVLALCKVLLDSRAFPKSEIKLQEYRMSQAEETDMALRHITVLEEAHNLLRRSSPDQAQESANLQGKSVEMLANAIAEMRTYGEGFIIADQSPALLDMAVIRNTNTKIIMRLPDQSDRELVGKAAGMNDDQISELARLELGVAAVFQNEWQEPMLCKVQEFTDRKSFSYQEPEDETDEAMECVFERALYGESAKREISQEVADKVKRWLDGQNLDSRTCNALLHVIETGEAYGADSVGEEFYCLTRSKRVFDQARKMSDTSGLDILIAQYVKSVLHVSSGLANEIGKVMAMYTANHCTEGTPFHQRLMQYGGRFRV